MGLGTRGKKNRERQNVRSNIIEIPPRHIRMLIRRPHNENNQRRNINRRVHQQERQSRAEVIAQTAEEQFCDELGCLACDGQVVEHCDGTLIHS